MDGGLGTLAGGGGVGEMGLEGGGIVVGGN